MQGDVLLLAYVLLGCFFAALLHATGWESTTRDQAPRYTACTLYGIFWPITLPITLLVLFTWWMSRKLRGVVQKLEKRMRDV